jgi:repressor LexA
MNRLTTQQQAVYDFIEECIISRGYAPTLREIGLHMAIKSPNGVISHLRALERKGFIRRSANKSRAIELTKSINRSSPGWQVLGTIDSSGVELSQDFKRPIDPAATRSSDHPFLITVADDFLNSRGIHKGDQLVIQPVSGDIDQKIILIFDAVQNRPVIGDGSVTGDSIFFQPIIGLTLQHSFAASDILGVAVGIIRYF